MKHNPDKTDKGDAELLGDLHRVGYLPEVWLAPLYLRDFRQLVRFRGQEVEQRKRLKYRIRAVLRQFRVVVPERFDLATKWSKAWLRDNLSFLQPHSQ